MKIIAFTFAGGNKYSYNNFFPKEFETVVLEYPGRGKRVREPLLTRLEDVVADLLPKVEQEIATADSYLMYGHSMGAIVAYEVCKHIEKKGLALPEKLIINGVKGPQYCIEKIISNLSNQDFWDEITQLGGIPNEVGNNPELLDFFVPILKADYKCVETYQYDVKSPAINVPIAVFYGSEEDITEEEAAGWKEVSSKEVNITKLTGDHFFIFKHDTFFTNYFQKLRSFSYE